MKNKVSQEIKNTIRNEREIRKITQAELAKYLGVSRQTLSQLEKQNYNPSLYLAMKISRVLHQPIDYLFQVK